MLVHFSRYHFCDVCEVMFVINEGDVGLSAVSYIIFKTLEMDRTY